MVKTRKKVATNKGPLFVKQDIIDFITTYDKYTDKTRNIYLTAYDNSRQRDKSSPVPDFTSADLLDNDKFNAITKHKKGRLLLCPMTAFLQSKFLKNNEWTNVEMRNLQEKISTQLSELQKIYRVNAFQKNSNTEVTIRKEDIDTFYSKLINPNQLQTRKAEADYRILGLIFSVLTVIQCRDDVGNLILNPSDTEREKESWIDLRDGTISIAPKKKNTKRHIVKLPQRQWEYIRNDVSKKPRRYLLTKKQNNELPYGTISFQFGRLMKLYFGKTIGFNDIRKSYTSWANTKSPEIAIEVAKRQGHSISTAMTFYSQNHC
jgi:integrase